MGGGAWPRLPLPIPSKHARPVLLGSPVKWATPAAMKIGPRGNQLSPWTATPSNTRCADQQGAACTDDCPDGPRAGCHSVSCCQTAAWLQTHPPCKKEGR